MYSALRHDVVIRLIRKLLFPSITEIEDSSSNPRLTAEKVGFLHRSECYTYYLFFGLMLPYEWQASGKKRRVAPMLLVSAYGCFVKNEDGSGWVLLHVAARKASPSPCPGLSFIPSHTAI